MNHFNPHSMLYNIVKTLHIVGFATAFGISLATLFAYSRFWKLYGINREQGIAAFKAFAFLQRIGMIGLMLVLLAGLSMLALRNWVFVSLLWFQIKLAFIALIFINGFTQGRTSTMKLDEFVTENKKQELQPEVLQKKLRTFLSIQLIFYITIIAMSVFRFV